jgi:TonB family protein
LILSPAPQDILVARSAKSSYPELLFMTRNFLPLLSVVLALSVYSQRGYAQFKSPTAGDSVQAAAKASASDHNAHPADAQQSDYTSPDIQGGLGGLEIAPYKARIREVFRANWLHLIHSSEQDFRYRNGKTVIEFTISREGEIRDMRIIQSSDQDDLDNVALQCIALSNPLPAPPKGVTNKELTQKVTFMFRGAKKPLWKRN